MHHEIEHSFLSDLNPKARDAIGYATTHMSLAQVLNAKKNMDILQAADFLRIDPKHNPEKVLNIIILYRLLSFEPITLDYDEAAFLHKELLDVCRYFNIGHNNKEVLINSAKNHPVINDFFDKLLKRILFLQKNRG